MRNSQEFERKFSGFTVRISFSFSMYVLNNKFSRELLLMHFSASTRIAKKQTWRQYSNHVICSMPVLSVLFFFIIDLSALIVLVFYYNSMLEKVTMPGTQQFSAFSLSPKKPR